MSSTNKTANYQLSQFVGTDIPSILNDYNGDMRKIDSAIKETSVAGGDNATAIAELQATTGRLSTEVGSINSTVNSVSGRVLNIEDKIPANASAENKLITAEDIPEIPSVEQIEQNVANLQTNVGELQDDVAGIKVKIPANASANNKLVTQADIPDVPSLEELETRVGKCETNIENIDAVIPESASADNKLATIEDIGNTGAILVLAINDVANPTQEELTQIQEFYNKYASHKDDYIFFIWNGIFFKSLQNLAVSNNRINIETFEVDSASTYLDFFNYSITLNTDSAGTILARNYSFKPSGITIEETSGFDNLKIAVIPVN